MWMIPVFLKVLFGNIATPIVLKKVTSQGSRSRRFRSQYIFAAVLVWAAVLLSGNTVASPSFGLVLLIGFLQSFGTYCYWHAIKISMSKTAVTTQFDDLLGMIMGYGFLGEMYYLRNAPLAAGIAVSLAGVFVYVWFRGIVNKEGDEKSDPSRQASDSDRALAMWVAGYSVLWGLAYFSLRFFALRDVSHWTFLSAWYTGALVGSQVILWTAGEKERGERLTLRGHLASGLLAVFIVCSLASQYWASKLTPITVHQPIYQVTEMVFPALIGLFYFKEIKALTKSGKAAIVLGIVGMALIALSYR
ncbi:MAG: hypothetical protein A3B31_01170 [Candidatus Komeilibacteria bacterium RIFCSPLOWO2_01_FULL_53_11]|uniref:EamA domain-containing protein n=1 Tax=Candidatus Komeilibacteria bacterium RIFCSPLOWO2_01_FULL_53_11 TaxID=1798552 RepID=A0A1G2BU84_9BACT|nr:MAG: hypothetical protein A3B31_01170 [Candidatus Komeilibacteria bacterium RIFCSPLOWO2_01_FULL_53_11]